MGRCDYFDKECDKNVIAKLVNMLMFSDRDRKRNKKAEKVYWLCIREINKRNPLEAE